MNPFAILLKLWRRRRREAEMKAEMAHHLELETERQQQRGLSATEALHAALRAFGNLASIEERAREVQAARWLEDFGKDVRLGARLLWREKLFTALGILVLALGLGATTALFSVLNAVVLRSLPVDEAERIVQVWETNPGRGVNRFSASFENYQDWAKRSTGFTELAAIARPSLTAMIGSEPERLRGVAYTANAADLFNLRVAVGRPLSAENDQPGGANVVLLSDRLWRTRLGRSEAILGTALTLNGASYTVIGIAAPEAGLFSGADVFLPLQNFASVGDRSNHDVDVYGRLQRGVTLEQAQAELVAIAAQLEREHPDSNAGWSLRLEPLFDTIVSPKVRRALWQLLGAVSLLLVIACANLSGLLLVRATGRSREFAVRAALGGGRGRLVRQLLAESLLLVVLGGGAGLLIAVWSFEALRSLEALGLPRSEEISLDARVLVFAAGATLLTALLAGLFPAWSVAQVDPQRELKDGGAAGRTRARPLRTALLVGQVALSLVLLTVAGLLLRSFEQLLRTDLGFTPDRILTARIAPGEDGRELVERWVERVRALPGVEAAAATSFAPTSFYNTSNNLFPVGPSLLPAGASVQAEWRIVTEDYFRALQIPLVRGRFFNRGDNADGARVVIVNQALARHLWGEDDPIGKQVNPGGGTRYSTVIGVVGDVRSGDPETPPAPQFYLSAHRWVWSTMTLVVRARGDGSNLVPMLRDELRALAPAMPMFEVTTLEESLDARLAPPRNSALLVGLFSLLAAVLAATGLFAMVAQATAQRTREIGIRIALGASRAEVIRPLLREGLRVTVVGVILGLLASAAGTQVLGGMLHDVSPLDPMSFAAAAIMLMAVALVACWVPARRAARVDPMVALRGD